MSNRLMKHWFPSLPFLICIFFVLLFLVAPVPETRSAQITFSWTPNSEPDLYCYRIYKTTTAGQYRFVKDDPDNNDMVWEGTENTATVTADEACVFVVTAVDTAGNESGSSDEVAYQPSSTSESDGISNTDEHFVGTDPTAGDVNQLDSTGDESGDEAGGSDGGGCLVATAAFGSPMERQVAILKSFRDTFLLRCAVGRIIVRNYNKYSPPLAHFIAKHEILKAAVRMSLLPLVAINYATLHFGPTITLTMLVVFLGVSVFLVSRAFKKSKDQGNEP